MGWEDPREKNFFLPLPNKINEYLREIHRRVHRLHTDSLDDKPGLRAAIWLQTRVDWHRIQLIGGGVTRDMQLALYFWHLQ